jgi:FkbM family methyltransferase
METLAPLYAECAEQSSQLPGGAHIRLDLNEHVERWIYFFGAYEKSTVRWFASFLRPGMTFLDVGAHVGQYSLIAAKNMGALGRVHSFEPNPTTFHRLSANLALNVFETLTPHNLALSDSVGAATLYIPKHDNRGEASMQACDKDVDQATVASTTLDEWSKTADLGTPQRVDIIKIDVQGFEAKVVTGARSVLKRFRPVVLCEFEERWLRLAGSSSVELKELFRGLGYSVNRIVAGRLAPVAMDDVHDFENLVLTPGSHGNVFD